MPRWLGAVLLFGASLNAFHGAITQTVFVMGGSRVSKKAGKAFAFGAGIFCLVGAIALLVTSNK
jgi:hypothetical protein